jgi:hypothetical protein
MNFNRTGALWPSSVGLLIIGVGASLLSGCASTAGTFFNRPVVEDSIKDALSTVSLSADRRTVVVITEGEKRGKFCAEPPPDTATGLKTEVEASLRAKTRAAEAAGKFGEKLETSVVVLAERTPALDAFRTGVYALCQYHLNGALADADVKPVFLELLKSFESMHNAAAK